MSEHGGEDAFRIFAGQREGVSVADTRGDVAQQYFTLLRAIQIEHFDFEWFACFPGNGSTCLHDQATPLSVY